MELGHFKLKEYVNIHNSISVLFFLLEAITPSRDEVKRQIFTFAFDPRFSCHFSTTLLYFTVHQSDWCGCHWIKVSTLIVTSIHCEALSLPTLLLHLECNYELLVERNPNLA